MYYPHSPYWSHIPERQYRTISYLFDATHKRIHGVHIIRMFINTNHAKSSGIAGLACCRWHRHFIATTNFNVFSFSTDFELNLCTTRKNFVQQVFTANVCCQSKRQNVCERKVTEVYNGRHSHKQQDPWRLCIGQRMVIVCVVFKTKRSTLLETNIINCWNWLYIVSKWINSIVLCAFLCIWRRECLLLWLCCWGNGLYDARLPYRLLFVGVNYDQNLTEIIYLCSNSTSSSWSCHLFDYPSETTIWIIFFFI